MAVQENGKDYGTWTYNIEVDGSLHEKISSTSIGMEQFSESEEYDDEYYDDGY